MKTAPTTPLSVPPADLLPVQRKATFTYRLMRIILLPVFHVLFVFQVKGRRNVPKGKGFVLISNHLNWLDSFVITASFPPEPRMHFLGDPYGLQARRFQWAFIKSIGGYIPVNSREGSGPALYHHVDTCLQRGGIVALYPEGGTAALRARSASSRRASPISPSTTRCPCCPSACQAPRISGSARRFSCSSVSRSIRAA